MGHLGLKQASTELIGENAKHGEQEMDPLFPDFSLFFKHFSRLRLKNALTELPPICLKELPDRGSLRFLEA
jgi:hypothetical protein